MQWLRCCWALLGSLAAPLRRSGLPAWRERMRNGGQALSCSHSVHGATKLLCLLQRSRLACPASRVCRSRRCVLMQRDCGAVMPSLRPGIGRSCLGALLRSPPSLPAGPQRHTVRRHATGAAHGAWPAVAPSPCRAGTLLLHLTCSDLQQWSAAWPGAEEACQRCAHHRPNATCSGNGAGSAHRGAKLLVPAAWWLLTPLFVTWHRSNCAALPSQPGLDAAGKAGAHAVE